MDDVQRGQRLRELREAADLLQRQVGAVFDIDKQAVSSWEQGKSKPTTEKIAQLDDLYHANGEVLRLFGVETNLEQRVAALEQAAATRIQLNGVEHTVESAVTRLHADLRHLAETVRALGRVVEEELGVELTGLLTDEAANATPDESEPPEAVQPTP